MFNLSRRLVVKINDLNFKIIFKKILKNKINILKSGPLVGPSILFGFESQTRDPLTLNISWLE